MQPKKHWFFSFKDIRVRGGQRTKFHNIFARMLFSSPLYAVI